MTSFTDALARIRHERHSVDPGILMQIEQADWDAINRAIGPILLGMNPQLAEQLAEIARWKENAAFQQASAEGCMQQALKNGAAALDAEAALNDAVGLLREAIDWNWLEDEPPPESVRQAIDTFLAQHTTPPCADGG